MQWAPARAARCLDLRNVHNKPVYKSTRLGLQIWQYEGDFTLWDFMSNKNRSKEPFPYCMEELLFGESLGGPKDARRRQATVRLVLQQV